MRGTRLVAFTPDIGRDTRRGKYKLLATPSSVIVSPRRLSSHSVSHFILLTTIMDSESQSLSPRPPRSKRGRLSLACTQCRKRKVRCDATTPKCRNCVLRGDECQTFDPRRPNGPAVRKWPHKGSQSTSTLSSVPRRASIASQHSSPASLVGSQITASTPLSASGNKERPPSWIERAYQETTPESGTDGQTNDSPDVVMNTDESSHRIKVSLEGPHVIEGD